MKVIRIYDGYFLEVDVQYPEKLPDSFNDLPFLPERIKIEKVVKLVPNVHEKTEYFIYIKNLRQALNHPLVLKKLHKSKQKAWLKSYIDMNTDLRKKQKIILKKNNAVFQKTMENMRKHRDIRLVTIERKRNYLVLEPNYHST